MMKYQQFIDIPIKIKWLWSHGTELAKKIMNFSSYPIVNFFSQSAKFWRLLFWFHEWKYIRIAGYIGHQKDNKDQKDDNEQGRKKSAPGR